jgi:hypothetical protein
MRLSRLSRAFFLIFGLGLITAGVAGSMKNWSAAGVPTLIIGGMLPVLGAVVGVFPKGSIKEGTLEWPEVDKHPRVEAIEASIEKLLKEVKGARQQSADIGNLLIDYMLANSPNPDDGMTDEERLDDLREGLAEVTRDIDYRYFTGETYDDGIGVEELERSRDGARRDLSREERRQAARVRLAAVLRAPKA